MVVDKSDIRPVLRICAGFGGGGAIGAAAFVLICAALFAVGQAAVMRCNPDQPLLTFCEQVQVASPATITGGRNIAFENGAVISKAPGTYINLLECCQSDEAIKSRIALGRIGCHVEPAGE